LTKNIFRTHINADFADSKEFICVYLRPDLISDIAYYEFQAKF